MSNPTVSVISRHDIPAIHEVEKDGKIEKLGELRDFRWNDTLSKFLPHEDVVSFSWVKLAPQEMLRIHEHATASMIICYRGTGKLIGQQNRDFNEGDVVAIPAFCLHGFIGGETQGLWALSIQFGPGIYTDPHHPRVTFIDADCSFESLIALNERCMTVFKQCRFLKMLTDGTITHKNKRQRYVEALQIWSDYNQDLLFARQGATSDKIFAPVFLEHLFEEVGHDRIHADRQEKFVMNQLTEDPIIEAIAHWFICQMFRSDTIAKAALIHLVIENGSDIYHKMARPVLHETVNDHYFEVHAADTEHAKLADALLNNLSAQQYKELHKIVDKGWKMIGQMTNRVCELVDEVH